MVPCCMLCGSVFRLTLINSLLCSLARNTCMSPPCSVASSPPLLMRGCIPLISTYKQIGQLFASVLVFSPPLANFLCMWDYFAATLLVCAWLRSNLENKSDRHTNSSPSASATLSIIFLTRDCNSSWCSTICAELRNTGLCDLSCWVFLLDIWDYNIIGSSCPNAVLV